MTNGKFFMGGRVKAGLTAAVLLAVVAVAHWAAGPAVLTTPGWAAEGGIPDAGAQRNALTKALEANGQKIDETNKKLDRIIELLASGKVKVVVAGGEGAGNGN